MSTNEKAKDITTWNDVDWKKINQHVRKTQYQIYDASRLGNTKQVHKLQKRLARTLSAKLYAVHLVSTLNEERKVPGVDRTPLTAKQKMEVARSLQLDGRTLPTTRFELEKPGNAKKSYPKMFLEVLENVLPKERKTKFCEKKNTLSVETIQDRAKQALAKTILEPEWEARFEPSSYGFRPGRGCHDAIERIFTALNKNVNKWVFSADIRDGFDKIDHIALLQKVNTFPEMARQIKAWLKAGVMERYSNTPKNRTNHPDQAIPEEGVQGVLFPLLANIALHGLEFEMKTISKISAPLYLPKQSFVRSAKLGFAVKSNKVVKSATVVRYLDNFVCIHPNREIVQQCIKHTETWLAKLGLTINQERSILRDGREGFDFLGFRIILVKRKLGAYKVKIYPAKAHQISILDTTRQLIAARKACSSYQLIEDLRPKIIGWGNYYNSCECKSVFSKLSNDIFQQIRAWVFRRDSRHGRYIVKEKYFPSGKSYIFNGKQYKDNWILVGKQKDKSGKMHENFLPHMSWIKRRKHVMVKGDATPFDKQLQTYWTTRSKKYLPERISA